MMEVPRARCYFILIILPCLKSAEVVPQMRDSSRLNTGEYTLSFLFLYWLMGCILSLLAGARIGSLSSRDASITVDDILPFC